MTWHILRHAQKASGEFHNSRLRHQDQPLSVKGSHDAETLANYFADKPIAAIYVSEYQRTWQTVQVLAERKRLMPLIDERMNEIDNGLIDALTPEEFKQSFPAEWEAYTARKSDFRFPGGETGAEAQQRVIQFLETKQQQHAGENVLVVSHDGLIRALMCYVMGIPVYRRGDFQVDLCGLLEMDYQEQYSRWKLIRFNQTCC